MVNRLFPLLVFFLLIALPQAAWAGAYDVSNIQVTVDAQDAVRARDQAIFQAQRQAFATLVGRPQEKIAGVTDDQIARMVTNFSIQGERMTSRSYMAHFTVRFNPGRAQNFIQSHGFELSDPETRSKNIVVSTKEIAVAAPVAAGTTPPPANAPVVPAAAPVAAKSVIILPILDIGTRRILWDEPNPWRDLWQKSEHTTNGVAVRVPIGDIDDMTDIPDAGFLSSQAKAGAVPGLLGRYAAQTLYVALIKNQNTTPGSSGMMLALYRNDGDKVKIIRKSVLQSRAGHAFEDAIPVTLQMIAQSEKNPNEVIPAETTGAVEPSAEISSAAPVAVFNNGATMGSIVVTVPYQSLTQWVNIQRRLRNVMGVRSVIPSRVSPSSAQVRITSERPNEELATALRNSGFQLQVLPNGENALTEN